MSYIVSAVPGRLRIKAAEFTVESFSRRACEALCRKLPILGSRINRGAASIVIQYDAKAFGLNEIKAHAEAIVASLLALPPDVTNQSRPRKRSRRMRLNRVAKLGALASLAASMAFAYSGSKKMHIYTGGVFLACLCAHMAIFRRTLTH